MKRISVLLLFILTVVLASGYCQERDAFFLVDVSGSMRSQSINQEAKVIVQEILLGEFTLSDWINKGWSPIKAAGEFFSNPNEALLHDKGVFCLMPFGDMQTVYNYKVMIFETDNVGTFMDFYDCSFPTSHTESNTYLTLAKAYSVVVAAQKGLQGKEIWLVVYSDGMGDSMPSNDFPADLQEAWDKFGSPQTSIMKKKGTLRKYNGKQHFDVEVWTMGPIPNLVSSDSIVKSNPTAPPKFKITSPSKGISEQTAVEVKKDEYLNMSWVNNFGSVTMAVQLIQSGKAIKIDKPKDYYTKTVSAHSGKIVFHKSGVFKITIKDSKMNSDNRYVKVKGGFPLLSLILVLFVVSGGVAAYNHFKKNHDDNRNDDNGSNNDNSNSNAENNNDWE